MGLSHARLISRTVAVFVSVSVFCLAGCSSDNSTEPTPEQPNPYLSLDVRDHLLENLELAYNQRNFEEYRKLFDNTGIFQFFFSPTDVSENKVKNSQWDIARELSATEKMFDRNPPPGSPGVDDIDLEIDYLEGDSEWTAFVPITHPNETWYDKVVEYRLRVIVGLTTYTQNKTVYAVFTVRSVDVGGQGVWQIVAWYDDVATVPRPTASGQVSADNSESTWGGMKDLFAPNE